VRPHAGHTKQMPGRKPGASLYTRKRFCLSLRYYSAAAARRAALSTFRLASTTLRAQDLGLGCRLHPKPYSAAAARRAALSALRLASITLRAAADARACSRDVSFGFTFASRSG